MSGLVYENFEKPILIKILYDVSDICVYILHKKHCAAIVAVMIWPCSWKVQTWSSTNNGTR